MSDSVLVIGAGGHAKVVIATVQAAGGQVAAAYDDDQRKWGRAILGVPVMGPIESLPHDAGKSVILAVGRNQLRRQLAERFAGAGLTFATAIHPRAWVHASVTVGPGTVIFAGAMIQPDTRLGVHVIVNTGASVDHDCAIGDYVHIAPGVRLAGAVTIGEGAFLGIGSVALPGAEVGQWATVGAGAAVTKPIPAHVTAVGVPARPLPPPRGKR